MMFRKKSEDPWDQKPEKQQTVTPEVCPWCGREMRQGYLDAVRGGDIWWVTEKPGLKSGLLGEDPNTSLLVSDEGAFYTYKMAWYCGSCKKMTLDCKNMKRPYGTEPYEEADQNERAE